MSFYSSLLKNSPSKIHVTKAAFSTFVTCKKILTHKNECVYKHVLTQIHQVPFVSVKIKKSPNVSTGGQREEYEKYTYNVALFIKT